MDRVHEMLNRKLCWKGVLDAMLGGRLRVVLACVINYARNVRLDTKLQKRIKATTDLNSYCIATCNTPAAGVYKSNTPFIRSACAVLCGNASI
jgi:hypothetical protein